MERLRAFWNRGWLAKAIVSIVGLLVVCCVIGILVPKRTPAPVASQPTEQAVEQATAAPVATSTPAPTNAPKPTQTLVPTFTPEPTIVADQAGIDPVNGDCPAPYTIKISSTGLAHDLGSRSYGRTTPVHCYARMKDATDQGFTRAAD